MSSFMGPKARFAQVPGILPEAGLPGTKRSRVGCARGRIAASEVSQHAARKIPFFLGFGMLHKGQRDIDIVFITLMRAGEPL